MLEDLEASVGFQGDQALTVPHLLGLAKSASVTIDGRVLRLQRMVFASDFLLGQHQGRTVAVSYLAIRGLQLFAAGKYPSQVSKATLRAWIKTLPQGLSVSVVTVDAVSQEKSAISASNSKFLCLTPNLPGPIASAVPFSAVQYIEFDAVDNNIGLAE